jgi:hypothetical protein
MASPVITGWLVYHCIKETLDEVYLGDDTPGGHGSHRI